VNCGIRILKNKKGLLVTKRPFFSFFKLVINTAFFIALSFVYLDRAYLDRWALGLFDLLPTFTAWLPLNPPLPPLLFEPELCS